MKCANCGQELSKQNIMLAIEAEAGTITEENARFYCPSYNSQHDNCPGYTKADESKPAYWITN